MKTLLFPVVALLLLVMGMIMHWRHYIPLLPERVANHIDASGQANQWTDKKTFVDSARMFFAIGPLAFLGLGALGSVSFCYLPESMVNVPRKDYWLATPKRRQEAALLLFRFFLWFAFGMLSVLYFGAINSMVMTTLNPERNSNRLDLPLVALGVVFLLAQVGMLIYRLSHPPHGHTPKKEANGFGRES